MSFISLQMMIRLTRFWSPLRVCALLVLVALSGGCGQSDIKVYRIAKQASAAEPTQLAAADTSLPPGHPSASGTPALKWKLPAGWEEVTPGEMRVASFRVKGGEGKQADVSIIPLSGMAGGDLANVNRWLDSVGQPAVNENALVKMSSEVQISGESAKLFDIPGKNPGSDEKQRILAAIQHRGSMAWFFKMMGDEQLVAQQKPVFVDFLKSVSFLAAPSKAELPPAHPPIDGSPVAVTPPAAPDSDDSKPKWQVPAGWKETSGQFLIAKFLISGSENKRAAVNVSITGGGVAANVNRWRGQLGLTPLGQADLEKQTRSLEVPGGKAMLLDMSGADPTTGQKVSLVGIILPQSDRTWYYKLMGDPDVVAQQKDPFIKFVKSASYK